MTKHKPHISKQASHVVINRKPCQKTRVNLRARNQCDLISVDAGVSNLVSITQILFPVSRTRLRTSDEFLRSRPRKIGPRIRVTYIPEANAT